MVISHEAAEGTGVGKGVIMSQRLGNKVRVTVYERGALIPLRERRGPRELGACKSTVGRLEGELQQKNEIWNGKVGFFKNMKVTCGRVNQRDGEQFLMDLSFR